MKNIILSLVSLLLVQVASFAGVDLGASAGRTPYDPYMAPVKNVLGSLSQAGASMDQVKQFMTEGHNFRYSFTTPYVAATPEVTEATKSGDCKAKSLWLCKQLGDKNLRFVVGKAHANSKLSHAWVMWQSEGRWYILDPTNTSRPIAADSVSKNDYIAQFSWSKNGTFRHAGADGLMSSVAGKQRAVAAN